MNYGRTGEDSLTLEEMEHVALAALFVCLTLFLGADIYAAACCTRPNATARLPPPKGACLMYARNSDTTHMIASHYRLEPFDVIATGSCIVNDHTGEANLP